MNLLETERYINFNIIIIIIIYYYYSRPSLSSSWKSSTSALSSYGSRSFLPHRTALQPAAPAALFSSGNSRVIHGFICGKDLCIPTVGHFPCGRFLKRNSDFNHDVLSFISIILNVSFPACVCVLLSKNRHGPFCSVSLVFQAWILLVFSS